MQNFFDACQPYSTRLHTGHYSQAIDEGLAFLNEVKRSSPADYETPKGTPFYLLGIAAFHTHDFQTATFLFDAAVSEDLHHYQGEEDKPALLFMQLEDQNQNQAALDIVKVAANKLQAVIDNYTRRDGSEPLTLPDVRKHFLRHILDEKRPFLRTVTTAFISFLLEWDYRSKLIDLSRAGSREPFFTHLFRGCLLFESLIKMEPTKRVSKRATLDRLLAESCLLDRLRIRKVAKPPSTFDQIVQSLVPNQCIQTAIECTYAARNRLAHNFALEVPTFDGDKYELLANNIAASCLHAISCLYKRQQ
jgi:hypothetical protein